MEHEYKDFPITIFRDGEHGITDLDMYQREYEKLGWEYIGIVTLPSDDANKAEVVYRFRRPKRSE